MKQHKKYNPDKSAVFLSMFTLGLYLFGIFVVDVLHPLIHVHEYAYPYQSTENDLALYNNNAQNHSQAAVFNDFCALCHLGYYSETTIEKFNDEMFRIPVHFHFGEYLTGDIESAYIAWKHSRAPPFSPVIF